MAKPLSLTLAALSFSLSHINNGFSRFYSSLKAPLLRPAPTAMVVGVGNEKKGTVACSLSDDLAFERYDKKFAGKVEDDYDDPFCENFDEIIGDGKNGNPGEDYEGLYVTVNSKQAFQVIGLPMSGFEVIFDGHIKYAEFLTDFHDWIKFYVVKELFQFIARIVVSVIKINNYTINELEQLLKVLNNMKSYPAMKISQKLNIFDMVIKGVFKFTHKKINDLKYLFGVNSDMETN